jgi:serine/threonine protein phosphatase PrpC
MSDQGYIERGIKVLHHSGVAELRGTRPTIEDRHVVIESFGGNPGVDFYAGIDGHGGSQVADLVQARLPQVVLQKLYSPHTSMEQVYKDAFREVNEEIRKRGIGDRCGAVVAAALKLHNKLWVAGVGDVRVIADRKDGFFRLTHEDSATDPYGVSQREVIARGGMIAMGRTDGRLQVTRAFGDFDVRGITAEPQVWGMDIRGGIGLVILSDGLTKVIPEDKKIIEIAKSTSSPQQASQKLIQQAYKNYQGRNDDYRDDMTVIVANLRR